MIIVEFSIVPLGTGGTSMSDYVSKACREVEKSGVRYMITPMGTIIETNTVDKAFEVIKKAHEAVIKAGAARVSTSIKIDDRRDKERRMEDKVKAVKVKTSQ
ncbi:MAG: MTH1187 family thiamine-binding protein [Candidatus Verstraetearchaeota archaeon]|nr:MTH1187 family thiamine-binding protein [Candidatus Verstraetearchaeota archaeon]